MAVNIITRVRLLFVGVLLVLSLVGVSQTQKRCLSVEGNGYVRVATSLSNVVNSSADFCVNFDVKDEGENISFVIKPGSQYYLEKIEVEDISGNINEVPQERIYAERDDSLHFQCYDNINFRYFFVFKEVQPWQGGECAKIYRSKDLQYGQIYRPSEICDISVRNDMTISIQNNLEYASQVSHDSVLLSPHYKVINGNNKTIKNAYVLAYNKDNRGAIINNLHLFGGGSTFDYFDSISGTTMNSLQNSNERISFVAYNLQDCINFGRDGAGWAPFFIARNAKNLINWSSFYNKDYGCGFVLAGNNVDHQDISYIFNFSRIKYLLIASYEWLITIRNYFNDKNLAPDIELPTQEWAKGYNLESRQLIDSAFMRSLMGDSAEEDFIFEDGFYPRLRHMDERLGRLAASPILLYPGENADSVTLPFYVDTNYGVRWVSLNEDVIRIEGNIGYVRHPVLKETTVRVEAWKEDFNKHVYLTVPASNYVYQDLLSDTVCPGDSVKMINSYAKNEGWNYEVLETASAEYDTIYRMYLHHYPTYKEVVHRAAVERDSLPYIYGKDTIRQFGLTELHRYQTVHGCDSVIYVRLDTLYIHREQHFYDTLHTCEGGTLSWRGRDITQTGEYADTVFDPYRGGTDSIHHLRADIYPKYHDTFTDSCYIEELPHTVGGRPIQDFGTYTENLVTTAGCDSVREYELSRRWHHYRVSVRVKGAGMANVTDTVLREDGSLWLAFTASACNKLDSLKIDGKNVPPQNRYLLQNLHGDCTVEAVFGSAVPAVSVLRYEVCSDSLPVVYNGEAYGAGEHTIVLQNAQGCDSVLRLYVQGKENAARIAVLDTIAPPCGASEIAFSYRTETGSPKHLRLAFDPAALSAGFRDTTLAVTSPGQQTVHIALPPSAHPDRYGLQLWQADGTGCYAAEEVLTFEIPYPSDIIVQKWNDVLAVLSSEYNGGYEFSGYQWYKNGELLEGETRPYIYVKPYLRSTDTYAVLLERASDGLQLQSCGIKRKSYPKELTLELRPNPTSAGGEVQVSVIGKPEAEGTVEVFDGTGRPVYERAFRRSHTLRAAWQPGSYVVRVRDGKGSWTATGKLVLL